MNVKIAFTTDNTTERILPTLHKQVQYKYDKCGIYQLTCPTCKMKYTGHTDPSELDFRSTLEILNTAITNQNLRNTFYRKDMQLAHWKA